MPDFIAGCCRVLGTFVLLFVGGLAMMASTGLGEGSPEPAGLLVIGLGLGLAAVPACQIRRGRVGGAFRWEGAG